MRQVIIHAGFPKTATTSIQITCAKNQSKLEELGLHYPRFLLNNRPIYNHSIPFISMFTANPELYHINIRKKVNVDEANKKYEQQLNEILQKKLKKIVISGEGISDLTKSEISKMREKISSYGYGIRVIIFVRSPFSLYNSSLQQQIKSGRSIEIYKPPRIKNKIEKIISVFPEAEFHSFRDVCKHNHGPVGYFLSLIGVKNFSEIEFIYSNESLSNQAARLISYINEKQPFWIKKTINPLRSQGDTNIFKEIKGDKFKLTSNELEKFKHTLDRTNEYLLEKFGAEFCDSKPYLPLEEENHNHWSEEQLEQLKVAVSRIDNSGVLKGITYDYFKNIIKLDEEKLFHLGLAS